MKRIVLISFCAALAACSGSSVPPGTSTSGCTGLSAVEWAAIPAKEMGAGGINGVNVKAKMQIPSQLKAPMLGFGSTKITARVPSAVAVSQSGNTAYVMITSPAVLSWNGKNIKCKAA